MSAVFTFTRSVIVAGAVRAVLSGAREERLRDWLSAAVFGDPPKRTAVTCVDPSIPGGKETRF